MERIYSERVFSGSIVKKVTNIFFGWNKQYKPKEVLGTVRQRRHSMRQPGQLNCLIYLNITSHPSIP